MAKYTVTIIGRLDSDDPTLDYLRRRGVSLNSAADVSRFVEDLMLDQVALDLTEIRVDVQKTVRHR